LDILTVSKYAIAHSDAEWIWETYASGTVKDALAWLTEQLGNVAHKDRTIQILLERAVHADARDAIDLLLTKVSKVDDLIMDAAAWRGDRELLRRLIAAGGDVNAIGMNGPLLFGAILRGDRSLVSWLLDAGANIELEWLSGFGTPLMQAAALGNRPMVELLLERGANPSAFYDDDTPESVARARGHEELAEMLRKAR
jgi:ankyrin repeat protein